jgi:hypothetical protein
MPVYGFEVGSKRIHMIGKTEKHALINLVKHWWEAIDKYEKIELLGELENMEDKNGRD